MNFGRTSATGPSGRHWMTDKTLWLALLLLAIQLVWSVEGFDSTAARANPEAWARIPENRGFAFRLLLIFVGISAFLMRARLVQHLRAFRIAATDHARMAPLCLQCGVFALSFCLAIPVFADPFPFEGWQWPVAVLWWLMMSIALALVAWVLAPMSFWRSLLARERRALFCSAGLVAAYAMVLRDLLKFSEQALWSGELAQLTLYASVALLQAFYSGVMLDPGQAIMGLGDFRVHISAECSGIEGAVLLLALVCTFLAAFRTDLKFPAAFALLALAVPMSLTLNVLRIAVLVAIGHEISPEWAIKGFHIYGGLVLLVLECALLWALSQTAWFSHPRARTGFILDFEAALLIPLLVLLAATLLTGLLTIDFDWFYPLRVIAVAVALVVCFGPLRGLLLRPGWFAVLAGVAVLPLWLWLVPGDAEIDRIHTEALAGAPPWWAVAWLVFRFLGAAVTVPIAEELAFRGYLLRLLTRRPGSVEHAPLPFDWIAFAGSSLLFGILHGHWLAGTLAGMVYGVVRYRSGRIGDAVIAHATTNASLAIHVLMTGQWSYW